MRFPAETVTFQAAALSFLSAIRTFRTTEDYF